MLRFLWNAYSRLPGPARQILARVAPPLLSVAKPAIRPVEIGRFKMYLNPKDNAAFRYMVSGARYEPGLVNALRETIASNGPAIFFDVGASYGYYTISMADLIGGALTEIHSFEPDPRCFSALQRSVAETMLPIRINQALVGDTQGTATLFFSVRASTSNRSFQSDGPAFSVQDQLTLPSLSLSEYAKDLPVEGKAVFIKVDVEGSELRVLRGASALLQRARGFAIQFEWYPFGMKGSGLEAEDFIDYIGALGVDWAFVNKNGTMYRLDDYDHLISDMRTHEPRPGPRGIGSSAEYLIGKKLAPPTLAKSVDQPTSTA